MAYNSLPPLLASGSNLASTTFAPAGGQKLPLKKIIPLVGLAWTLALGTRAQSANYVTEIVTTYNGLWRSGTAGTATTVTNAVQPDSSHALLAFSANGTRYSTGVSDARLTSAGLTFTPGLYRALPVTAIPAPTANTKVGLGQLYDHVNNGGSTPPPVRDLARYLTDGPNGLDLGTGVANISAGTLTFPISSVQPVAISDGVPDLVITQFADPAGSSDVYSFLDANDVVVGTAVTVTYGSTFPIVGKWLADFYEASTDPMTLGAGFTKTPRDLRLWSVDLNDFNLPPSDYSRIAKFQVKLSGNSDVAFVAYNAQAITVGGARVGAGATPLPVELTAFTGQVQGAGAVLLTWRTASERNAAAFEVEASPDGRLFALIGRVPAHNEHRPQAYAYAYRPVQAGTTYYRLHQLDQDGHGTYSPTVAVALDRLPLGAAGLVAPVPFRQTLHVPLPTGGRAGEARLLALDGRQLYQHVFAGDELAAAASELTDLPALAPGIYVLQVVLDGQATRQKVVKD